VAVPRRTALEAASVLRGLVEEFDYVLFEYFLTDLAGHRGGREERFEQAVRVESLLARLLDTVELSRHRVVVFSDHGNLEEADHDRHTLNRVPLLAWGYRAVELVGAVDSMEALTPALVSGA